MARPGLWTHRKFRRLARLLGATYKAVGVLETLWAGAYADGDPRVGSAEDVEFAVGWDGEEGACAAALLEAGFLDQDEDGELVIHDLFDHAPDYVRKRLSREEQRRGKGRPATGQTPPAGQGRPDSDRSVTGQRPPNGRTPAPAPAPTPIPASQEAAEPPLALPDPPPKKSPKKSPKKTAPKETKPTQPSLAWYCSEFERVRGQPASPNYARDGGIMKELEERYGAELLRRMITRYLEHGDKDAFWRERGLPVPGLRQKAQEIVLALDGGWRGPQQAGAHEDRWTWGYSEADAEQHATDPAWNTYLDECSVRCGWGGELEPWPAFDEWLRMRLLRDMHGEPRLIRILKEEAS